MTRNKALQFLLVLALIALLGGCSTVKGWFSKKEQEKPPDIMAEEGIKQLKKKKYDDAIETFEKVRDRYPYSDQAMLAQIKVADAYFYKKKYDEALQAYKEFEKLHPTNKGVPYAIYRQGLCYYRQRTTIDRDQTYTFKALQEFRRLKQKFPKCEYIPNVDKYMAKCRNDLAEHEFYVAVFYFKTKHYKAALDRFQVVAQEYPEFPKQGEIKDYIDKCQTIMAEREEGPKSGLLYNITNLFDARW
ncbi:MAG: outer membrane protein assembly factor BamD [Deltaproteobacteria bacterium]|nr:MAG: outer membrane protein assembly factor BamD [Deltaproteobacteria bacterium]